MKKTTIGFGFMIVAACIFMAGQQVSPTLDSMEYAKATRDLKVAEEQMDRYVDLEYKAVTRTKEHAVRVEYLICRKASLTCQNRLKNGLPVTQETKDQLATFCHNPEDVPEQCRPNIVERVVYEYVDDPGWELEVLKELQGQEDYYRDTPIDE